MSVMTDDYLQAQYSVLGSVLIEPDIFPKVLQATRKEDFAGPCQTVYAAMCGLFQDGKPVDVVSVSAALGQEYRKFLMELMEITPSAANIDHYISLCREQAKVFAIRDIARRLAVQETSEGIRNLLDQANGLMVDKSALRITTMEMAMRSFMERHTGETNYLSWPVQELNDRLYAEPGDFILVGGYPSTGKSAWALQCGWHWAKDTRVGFFSLETSSEKLFDRQMSAVTNLTMDQIKRNDISQEAWDQVCGMTQHIVARNLELVPAAGMTPAEIRSVTAMRRFGIIIIDYVQLLSASGINRTEQVTNISLALHRMAQDMGVTILALSQLKRKSADDTPESSDLRESGQLEQDADIIMMLKLEDKDKPGGNREMFITKNKEGTCPKIVLAFDGKHQTFSKASDTGKSVSKYVAEGKKVRARNHNNANVQQQFSLLPDDDPKLPF